MTFKKTLFNSFFLTELFNSFKIQIIVFLPQRDSIYTAKNKMQKNVCDSCIFFINQI